MIEARERMIQRRAMGKIRERFSSDAPPAPPAPPDAPDTPPDAPDTPPDAPPDEPVAATHPVSANSVCYNQDILDLKCHSSSKILIWISIVLSVLLTILMIAFVIYTLYYTD